jgi:MinD-like ATPase involved in chromosome partitioning or flagellar assembly
LIAEIAKLGIDPAGISIVLNNHVRSESQMALADVQESLGHSITTTITPAPEMFLAAAHMHTPAVLSQSTHLTSQQIMKVADQILEREKAK